MRGSLRTQQRGPITDYFGMGPDCDGGRLALCVCAHGKRWPEGDRFEPEGKACRECVLEAVAEREARRS